MSPIYTYEAHKPDSRSTACNAPTPKFETLREAVMFCRDPANAGYTFRPYRPKNRLAILRSMLAEQGLAHLVIWYRPSHPQGWMICEEMEGPGYQRVGRTFRQAVDMLRGTTVAFMFGVEERP